MWQDFPEKLIRIYVLQKQLVDRLTYVLRYEGQEYYELEIKGFKRKLPLVQVSPDTWIAYFDSLGDKEFINHCAKELYKHLVTCDILMTTESKGIALVHELANMLNHGFYVVCRKEIKPFMRDPIFVSYKPITSSKELILCIDGRYKEKIVGKRVGIIDDIVSTGETLNAMEEIVMRAGGIVEKRAAILLEGNKRDDVIYLGILPIFKRAV